MEKELTEVYCGNGKGKTALAIGQSLRVATQGKSVIVIQFLKGRETHSLDFLQDVDNLDFKIFRFEKRDCCYEDLTEEEKAEQLKLRGEYINAYKQSLIAQLENTYILEPDGTKRKVRRKDDAAPLN